MKSLMKAILCVTLLALVLGCQNTKEQSATTEPETDKDKISYAIGVDMAKSISDITDEIDLPMLQKGMSDQIQEKELLVSKEEAQPLLHEFTEKLRVKQQEEMLKTVRKRQITENIRQG